PAFQRATAAWRRGEELFAEVSLDEGQIAEAGRFGVHPVLLDAALHAGLLDAGDAQPRLPLAWSGVRLHATGASSLRVRIAPAPDGGVSLAAFDEAGAAVVAVDSLRSGVLDTSRLGRRDRHEALFRVDWVEVPLRSPDGNPPRFAVLGDGLDVA